MSADDRREEALQMAQGAGASWAFVRTGNEGSRNVVSADNRREEALQTTQSARASWALLRTEERGKQERP